tara:strand:+ start:635 stop:1399 length:765 start_codon:yes stop_codon:yes gene_type:complete
MFLDSKFCNDFKPPVKNFCSLIPSSPIYSLSEQAKFSFQLNQYDFDLMLFPQFNARVFYNKPYVDKIHDSTLHFYFRRQRTSFISKLVYRLLEKIVPLKARICFAVSQNNSKDITCILKIPTSKLVLTYHGVTDRFKEINDQAVFKNVQDKYSLGEKYFLYSKARKTQKNITGIIKGFTQFLETSSEEYQLALNGPQDGIHQEIKKEILDHGLEDKIRIIGLVSKEELFFLMNRSRAYVFQVFMKGLDQPLQKL